LFIKQIPGVVADPAFNRLGTLGVSGERLDFCKRFEDKTGMKVIDKISLAIAGIVPRAICILRFEDEIQISFSDSLLPVSTSWTVRGD